MTWFNYTTSGSQNYAPVRRKIVFPQLSEKLKVGDWLHVNLDVLDIGKFYYYENGLIKKSFDPDAYLVVYETEGTKTATFSFIVDADNSSSYKRNLWFKSLTNIEPGFKPTGDYYIYYHKDNIQYISLQGSNYQSTTSPSGSNFIATVSGSSASTINYYSTEVLAALNERVSAMSFLGDKEVWRNGKTLSHGAKVLGPFSGPRLKIYADKNSSSGFIYLKIVKSSAVGDGQKVVKEGTEIDLYSPTNLLGQLIYELDMQQDLSFSTYEELYGEFYFEIETLEKKNEASHSIGCNMVKYAFSKNYELQFDKEEIKSDIAFKTIGGVK
jgi:hypothetical protein